MCIYYSARGTHAQSLLFLNTVDRLKLDINAVGRRSSSLEVRRLREADGKFIYVTPRNS